MKHTYLQISWNNIKPYKTPFLYFPIIYIHIHTISHLLVDTRCVFPVAVTWSLLAWRRPPFAAVVFPVVFSLPAMIWPACWRFCSPLCFPLSLHHFSPLGPGSWSPFSFFPACVRLQSSWWLGCRQWHSHLPTVFSFPSLVLVVDCCLESVRALRARDMSSQPKTRERRNWMKLIL